MLRSEARSHLDKYWQLSRNFFRKSDFELAAFFAITLIEEVGKIIIVANAHLEAEIDNKGFMIIPENTRRARQN
jgi:AbiV family abortive infection protein